MKQSNSLGHIFFIDLSFCLAQLANASDQLIITAVNGALFGVSSQLRGSGHVLMLLMFVATSRRYSVSLSVSGQRLASKARTVVDSLVRLFDVQPPN